MSRLALAAIAVAALSAGAPAPASKHEVFVEAPAVLSPESRAAVRVAVYESRGLLDLEPARGAAVDVALVGRDGKETPLTSGRTEGNGTLSGSFDVPALEDGDYTMVVRTKSAAGDHAASQPVKVKREYRILLVTDKPLYQPGQTIHLRALALGEMTLREAAAREVLFEVEDAKGNKVFKRRATTNDFGVAAIDFALADEVNMGDFRVAATLGTSKAEKAVTVKRYVLPKFKVATKTDKAFYLPKEKIKGSLKVDYFFGKPVKDGIVTIKASTFDVQFREFAKVAGKTDEKGGHEFEVQLPDYFVGQPLEKGNAFVQLEVSVIDPAEHEEKSTKTLNVADSLIQLNAVPESGKLVPGVENILYVLATAPDGSAVEADVTVRAGKDEVKAVTNASGFAAVRITPKAGDLAGNSRGDAVLKVELAAKDRKGNEAKRSLEIGSEYGRDQLLLRLDKAIYTAGEAIALDLFGTFDRGMIFLDAVRKGQTILTSTCEFEKGRAQYRLPLAPEMSGTLEIHAYKIMADGEIVRDTRIAYVQPPQDLRIRVAPDQKQYAPAGEAKIRFQVTDRDGKGVQAALGVIIVDESVYALQDMQPGLEKAYFTLQQELLQPKYGIKVGASIPELIGARELEAGKQEVAKILLAPAAPAPRRWNVNTLAEKHAQFQQKLQQIYAAMQSYIAGEKGLFWEVDPATNKRRFRSDLLRALVENAKTYKLPKENLLDPWGNSVTLDQLAKLDGGFTFDHWARLMSAQNVQLIWQSLVSYALEKDAVERAGGAWRHREGAFEEFAPKDARKDYFGEPFTMERLAKEEAAFTAENLAKMTAELRRTAVFGHVRQFVTTSGGVEAVGESWRFVTGLQEKVATKPFFRNPEGDSYELAELAKAFPAFAASNLARIADVDRRAALYGAIRAKFQKAGFSEVAAFDNGWKWKPGLLEGLVKEGLLTPDQARDVAGRAIDLDAIVAADAQFGPERMLGALHGGAAQKISQAVCSRYHQRTNALPPGDVVEQLVKDGHVKEGDVVDAWGTRVKLSPVTTQRPANLGCGLLSGRFTVLAAGPDRKFDTADDVNCGNVAGAGQYQPNYAGCAFYQQAAFAHSQAGARWGGYVDLDGGLALQNAPRLGKLSFGADRNRESASRSLLRASSAPAAKPMAEKAKSAVAGEPNETEDDEGGGAPLRVREYFPETLLWRPALITNADGTADLAVTMADSITTWRLTASANARGGLLGSTTHGIVCFQDFFVDIDFPVALTQNDTVSVPIAVYNYLKEDQTVSLQVSSEDWFELLDEPRKEVRMKADQVRGASYRIRVKKIGRHTLTVEARGSRGTGDAIKREVEVLPDGKMFETVINDRLSKRITKTIEVPLKSIDGSYKILAKVYPGVFSQLLEGVEGMLGMPHG